MEDKKLYTIKTKKYAYETVLNIEEYYKAEKLIHEAIYPSVSSERKRHINSRLSFNVSTFEAVSYINLILQKYMKMVDKKINSEELETGQFVFNNKQNTLGRVKQFTKNKSFRYEWIQEDTLYNFTVRSKENKISKTTNIRMEMGLIFPISIEFGSLRLLQARLGFKTGNLKMLKKIKRGVDISLNGG